MTGGRAYLIQYVSGRGLRRHVGIGIILGVQTHGGHSEEGAPGLRDVDGTADERPLEHRLDTGADDVLLFSGPNVTGVQESRRSDQTLRIFGLHQHCDFDSSTDGKVNMCPFEASSRCVLCSEWPCAWHRHEAMPALTQVEEQTFSNTSHDVPGFLMLEG